MRSTADGDATRATPPSSTDAADATSADATNTDATSTATAGATSAKTCDATSTDGISTTAADDESDADDEPDTNANEPDDEPDADDGTGANATACPANDASKSLHAWLPKHARISNLTRVRWLHGHDGTKHRQSDVQVRWAHRRECSGHESIRDATTKVEQ